MELQEICSLQNPLIKEYMRLLANSSYRRSAGKIAVEGPNLIAEALKAGLKPQAVFFTRAYLNNRGSGLIENIPENCRRLIVSDSLFSRMADTETPQAAAAIFTYQEQSYEALLETPLSLTVLLDRLQDPGNMGTVLRTAAAVGAGAVFYTQGSVDPYSPKVLRSTAGTLFHVPHAAVKNPLKLVEQTKAAGLQILITSPRADRSYWDADLTKPSMLVIGNESAGVSTELAKTADVEIAIPLTGTVESLNASVAAGIILYEALRQRLNKMA